MSSGGYWGPSEWNDRPNWNERDWNERPDWNEQPDWNERPGFGGRGGGQGGVPPIGDGLLPTPPLYNPAPYSGGGLLPDPSPYGMPRDPWERQQYSHESFHDLPMMGHRGPSGLLPRPPLRLNWRVVEDYSDNPNRNKKRSQYKMDDYHPPYKQSRQSPDNHNYLGSAGYSSHYKYGGISRKRGKRPHLVMTTDLKGFILTCNSHEWNCINEAFDILTSFGDKLFGPHKDDSKENTDDTNKGNDKEEREEAEESQDEETKGVNAVGNSELKDDRDETETTLTGSDKEKNGKDRKSSRKVQDKEERFCQVITGSNYCMFIKTTLEDPLALSLAIMDDILETKKQQTRHLLRLVPVQTTCLSSIEEMEKASRKLAQEYFKEGGKTYGFFFKARTNKTLDYKTVRSALLKVLEEAHPDNSLDSDAAEVVLSVEIINEYSCVSLLPHYFGKYAKYNLLNIAKRAMEEKKVKKREAAGDNTDHEHKKDTSSAEYKNEGNKYEGDKGNVEEEENQEGAMDNWTNLGEEMEED